MAKSLRSKHVRRMKAAKRVKYGQRENARLVKMLMQAGDYQVVPPIKEEPMDPAEPNTVTQDDPEILLQSSEIVPAVTRARGKKAERKLSRSATRSASRVRRSRRDEHLAEQDSSDEDTTMEVATPDKEKVVRVYSRRTKRDQFGNYPDWMSVRKINKQKKRNKRLHNKQKKLMKSKNPK